MKPIKAFMLAAGLLGLAAAGCGPVRGGSAQGGGTQPVLPETVRLESAMRNAPVPGPQPPLPVTTAAPDALPAGSAAQPPHPGPAAAKASPQIPKPGSRLSAAASRNAGQDAAAAPAERAQAAKAKKDRPEKKSVPVQQHRVAQKALSLAQLRQKYSSNFKVSGSPSENKIALTFDDGPDGKFTAQVLDVLKKHNVKATFFVVGFRAQAHPELIARMVREGHIVGNHSYSHANLPKLSEPNFEKQFEQTQSVLKGLLGYEPKLFRPPYGAVNEEQVRWAVDHQIMIVNWNVDSLDWKGLSADKVAGNILAAAKPGSIILQHCGGGDGQDLSGTVEALPAVIQKLRSRGYELVTVPELLHVSKSK
jgi:peptidoglycan/xylan/chitin deacetylase (PgdA/CDA1 family)